MMIDIYRSKARSCNAQAKRERNPDVRAMLQRNARAFYALARQELVA